MEIPPNETFRTTSDHVFLINDPNHALYIRRQRCGELLVALRALPAGSFTVEEIGLLLLTNVMLLNDSGLTRIEAMWSDHLG